ncbi:LysR family transcriptional regulator [Pokkaliibacter sp. CJK22405]|uniref:LysR family transcriptional regulator n=1 Tax=Pokkaliibacter sp. CJK22405 TaxID=3384615 RepID=UPI003985403B
MMTIKQLRAFVAVAETLSFADACERVFLSQPALSLAIKSLEDHAGGRLFRRTTRRLSLTPEGESFFPVAQRLIADWQAAEDELHNRFTLKKGKVAIAAMPSFASNHLPHLLHQFRQKFPDITIEVHDVIAEQVVEMVSKGRVELGLSFEPPTQEALSFVPLFEDAFIALLPPDHALAKQQIITGQSLFAEDFITLQRPSTVRTVIEQQAAQLNLAPRIAFDSHQLSTVGKMVATGLGVSIVPALCQQQMEELGAVCRPLTDPDIRRNVGVITRASISLSAAAEAMRSLVMAAY